MRTILPYRPLRGVQDRSRPNHHPRLLATPWLPCSVSVSRLPCVHAYVKPPPLELLPAPDSQCFPKFPPLSVFKSAFVQAALDKVMPGDTIKISEGNWFEDVKTMVRVSRTKSMLEARHGNSACGRAYCQTLNRRHHSNVVPVHLSNSRSRVQHLCCRKWRRLYYMEDTRAHFVRGFIGSKGG